MPTSSTRWARAASRKETSAASRKETNAPARKQSLGPIRKNTGPVWPKSFHASPRRPYPPGPIVAPDVIAELRREQRAMQLDLLLLKRDLAWQDVIDKAIRMCRLLRQAELAELDAKYRPDQPRVPAGNPDGGQWVDDVGGGGTAAAGVAATVPADGTINIDEAAQVGAQAAADLRAMLQAGGRIVTAAGAATSALTVGILIATATSTGGTQQEQVETLADGTVVTVSSYGDTPDKTIRAESPDGTVTYATIAIDKTGSVKVLGGEVHSPGGGRQPIDPNAFAVAAGGLINAATGGGGGKTKPSAPNNSGVAATPPPEGLEPDGRPQPTDRQSTTSKNYREIFLKEHPELRGHVNVHRSVEEQVLKIYPGRFTAAEINSLPNLRGIPNNVNSQVHLNRIRLMWNRFYESHSNATRQQIIDHAKYIDRELGRQFAPTIP